MFRFSHKCFAPHGQRLQLRAPPCCLLLLCSCCVCQRAHKAFISKPAPPYSHSGRMCRSPRASTAASRTWVCAWDPCASTPTLSHTVAAHSSVALACDSRAPLGLILRRWSCLQRVEYASINQSVFVNTTQ